MPLIELQTTIYAPVSRCFDLSRSIDLHTVSTSHTNERAVAGVTSGLISVNESVTWEARHFGIAQRMTTIIPEMKRPHYFLSVMAKGAFKHFVHRHEFTKKAGITLMQDRVEFASPLGLLGKLVDLLIMEKYMKKLLLRRNEVIKDYAEGDKWKGIIK